MSNLVPQNFGAVSTKFAQVPVNDDLSSGIQSSFGIIGYKGKVWSIRYRGEEKQLMRDDGDGARGSVEVVILKASSHISKIWYEQGYVEGSNAAPDCFSNNGVVPEPSSLKKQSNACATCPMNAWGSRITPAGKNGKACADSKRLAVVPQADVLNETFGGPMLLRVPAASLQDLAMYGQKMNHMGYPYFAVATKISFDPNESYPKFIFSALRALTDEEAETVLTHQQSEAIERILSENEFQVTAPPVEEQEKPLFEQNPDGTPITEPVDNKAAEPTATKGAAKPEAKKAAPKKAAPPVEEVKVAPVVETAPVQENTTAEEVENVAEEESDEDRELRELQEQMAAIKARKAAQVKTPAETAAATATAGGFGATKAVTTGVTAGNGSAKPDTGQSSAPASSAAGSSKTSNSGQTATTDASPSENVAAGFEADLDSMLAELLPN